MKKLILIGGIVFGAFTLTAVDANAASSLGGHYYYGTGSVINNWSVVNIHAIAKNDSSKISKVIAKGTTNNSQNGYDSGVKYAEINKSGSPAGVNKAITGAIDSKGYTETVHSRN